jgi:UDP:flavonoid glycosyltransferase YjiC (YdhE family)
VRGANAVNVRPEIYDGGDELLSWLRRMGSRPMAYVTLGTVFNGNLALFRLVADALADEPCDVVMTLGHGNVARAVHKTDTPRSTSMRT